MPKLDLLDLETLINLPASLLSPLEASHPIELSLRSSTVLPNIVCQEPTSATRRSQAEPSGVFYRPQMPKLKVEMEMFADLSLYCEQSKAMAAKAFQNAVDELNTPVFEKAPFDYDRLSHSAGLLDVVTSTEDPFSFKIKSELPSIDTVNIDDNLMIKEGNMAFVESESKDISSAGLGDANTSLSPAINNYVVISSHDINTNSSNVFTPSTSEYQDMLYRNPSGKVTPLYKDLVNEDDEYLPTVNNCSDIFYNHSSYGVENGGNDNSNSQISDSSNHQFIILQTAPFETPDNSRSASEFSETQTLRLDVDQKYKTSSDVLDTPDVIEAIDAIENDKGFNILNFITEEDINTAEPTLSTLDIPVITSTVVSKESLTPTTKTPTIAKYPLKRRHRRDDDDEDYVPPVPAKRRVVGQKTIKIKAQPLAYDSSSSDEDEDISQSARKGRPRKSVTSEDYGDSGDKYREMRDKNNEASRKSRLKRKLKEVAQEEEAQELNDRNTKLKAQVAELERTVTNFRNNLMQILLSK